MKVRFSHEPFAAGATQMTRRAWLGGLLAVGVLLGDTGRASAQEIFAFTGPRRRDGLLAAGAPHRSNDLTNRHRFAILLRRLETRPRASLPAPCDLAPDYDAVVVHMTITNRQATPFAGVVELFVLVWRLDGREDGADSSPPTCGLGDPISAYHGDLDPPILAGAPRNVRMLFAVPHGAQLVRLDYHNDDWPARFAVPSAHRPRRRTAP